ncbi:MAG: arginine--tRNA ligase [Candidatus Zambryskibacteria bacterium CG_4_9_14_3_um_filter_42_9]|nr:MAG: arginine--tRNA ligase [Candidatus Zambryskibacteria bacterium CG_4_9_14_3_um_filter_42_9]
MKSVIVEEIRELIQKALDTLGLETSGFVVEHPADLKMGDYSTNAAIKYGHGEEILSYLNENRPEGVKKIMLAGPGFINFYLSKEFFKKSLGEIIDKGDEFGKNQKLKRKKIFIEHTQPNPFKEFHIGHLMNNAIGEAIARIVSANGALVKTASYHGDVGLHVAKAVWAIKHDHDLKYAYAVGAKAYEEDDEVKKEIQDINKKIYEHSDEEINKIYDMGKKASMESFYKLYRTIGATFDYCFFESEAGALGKQIVMENLGKTFEESEGAIVFKGEKFGLHTRVFLNREKLPTYEAKEIALALIKKNIFPYDKSITITGNEQDAFFNVVEKASESLYPELEGKLKHLSHGMLRLPSGKMSSRAGKVITAEELIESVKEKVKGDEMVAIGAIKYMILRQSIGNDIVFDVEKSVSTEGDSGVYLQYAYARANSLLEKANIQGPTLDINSQGQTLRDTHEIEKILYRFPEVIERAGQEYAPHYITTYLTELAGSFNNFYAHEQVIDDSLESPYRLAIVKAFNIVMKNGLSILGIPSPEKM